MSATMIGGKFTQLLRDIEAHFNTSPIEIDLWHCTEEDYYQFEILVYETDRLNSRQFIEKLQTVHRIYHRSLATMILFNFEHKEPA